MILDLGLLCPSCSRVFQLDVETDSPAEDGATTVHCPVCKTHPALVLLRKYKIMVLKGVPQYPPAKIVEPMIKVVTK